MNVFLLTAHISGSLLGGGANSQRWPAWALTLPLVSTNLVSHYFDLHFQ